ncbi:hypothetical protein WDW86_00590 [Bdellovibrionota bacterium FG-2]
MRNSPRSTCAVTNFMVIGIIRSDRQETKITQLFCYSSLVQTGPIDCIFIVSERFDYLGYDPDYWNPADIRAARAKLEEQQASQAQTN